jgi:uncharacterized protein
MAFSVTCLGLLGLLVFAGLCGLNALWLCFFRFGPAEWIWRSLTYGRAQSMFRSTPRVTDAPA